MPITFLSGGIMPLTPANAVIQRDLQVVTLRDGTFVVNERP